MADWVYWISLIGSIASIIGLIIVIYPIYQTHKEKTLSVLYVHGANGHGQKLAIFFFLSVAFLFAFGLTNYEYITAPTPPITNNSPIANITQNGQNIESPTITGIVNGNITFNFPPEIRPEKATIAPTTTPAPISKLIPTNVTLTASAVKVNYSGQTIDKISYTTPDIGKTFLLVDITIANHGYDDVSTNPGNFYIEINNVKYGYDSSSYSLKEIGKHTLEMADLADGGQISGYLVFQIPANENKYQLIYDNYEGYDVRYD